MIERAKQAVGGGAHPNCTLAAAPGRIPGVAAFLLDGPSAR